MGACWSEPPEPPVKQKPVSHAVQPSAPPLVYTPPLVYNPNYTYAMKPDQQVYYQYPQQQYPQQQYPQQQYPQQQYPQQQYQYYQQPYYPRQQQQQMSAGTAFVGGLVLGAMVDDILDPT